MAKHIILDIILVSVFLIGISCTPMGTEKVKGHGHEAHSAAKSHHHHTHHHDPSEQFTGHSGHHDEHNLDFESVEFEDFDGPESGLGKLHEMDLEMKKSVDKSKSDAKILQAKKDEEESTANAKRVVLAVIIIIGIIVLVVSGTAAYVYRKNLLKKQRQIQLRQLMLHEMF